MSSQISARGASSMIVGLLAVGLVALAACGGCGGDTSGGDDGAAKGGDPYANIDKASAGTITGTVKFTGTPPEKSIVKVGGDPVCAQIHGDGGFEDESHIQGPGGELKNVLVYLDHDFSGITFPTPGPAILDQRGCRYEPHVWGIMVGQGLTILNSDPTLHNVNCKPKSNKGFNDGMPRKGMKLEKEFTKAEVPVYFKCDVHPWMNAYAGVFAHPFFRVTGTDGTFELEHVPAGTYKVSAWHEKWGFTEGSATVEAGGTATVEFSYDGSADQPNQKAGDSK